MKLLRHTLSILVSGSMFLAACSTVPLTGRKQLSLVPSSQMMSMSYQQYGEFVQSNNLSANQE